MSSMSSDDTLSRSCRLKTSTGTGVVVAVRPWRRVPTMIISSSVSSTSCCAIAVKGNNAEKANVLVIRTNQVIGGFLLIVMGPRLYWSNLLIIAVLFPRRVPPMLVALEIVRAERSAGISPAILAPVSAEADVFCERLETGQLAHVAEVRIPEPVGPDHIH